MRLGTPCHDGGAVPPPRRTCRDGTGIQFLLNLERMVSAVHCQDTLHSDAQEHLRGNRLVLHPGRQRQHEKVSNNDPVECRHQCTCHQGRESLKGVHFCKHPNEHQYSADEPEGRCEACARFQDVLGRVVLQHTCGQLPFHAHLNVLGLMTVQEKAQSESEKIVLGL